MSKRKAVIRQNKVSPKVLIGIALLLFVGISLYLRIALPYHNIFNGGWVKFASNDAYYYMRLADNISFNFPHLMAVDPYLLYPNGQPILSFYLFARLLACASWIISMGHPTQHIVDLVGVYTPAVMGALVVIPVYFIGRTFWGRSAGLVSAALIAVMPGEFLGRSILGFTDHHIAEVLFSAVSVMFLVMAVKIGEPNHLAFGNLRTRGNIKAIIYAAVSGAFLGIYGLTWQAGLLFLFIVSLYFIVQFMLDHLKQRDTAYLCVVSVIYNLFAIAVFLPSAIHSASIAFYLIAMGGALLLPLVLWVISWYLKDKLVPYYYPLTVFSLGVVGALVFYLVSPSFFREAVDALRFIFVPSMTQRTTIEMQPLLFPTGTFTLSILWGNFGLTLFIALIALVVLFWNVAKYGEADRTLIAVWSLVIIAMALAQRRFAYYLAVNVSLLVGFVSWWVLKWNGLGAIQRNKAYVAFARNANMAFMVLAILLVVFLPIAPLSVSIASNVAYAPSDDWCESLDWLRENSPEPFGISNAYWYLSDVAISSDTDYGVLSWWDYGYWITRIAHRVPVVNPGQDPVMQAKVASFFTAQDEDVADGIMDDLGAKYVVIDYGTATGKLWAVATYAGGDYSDYFGLYYVQDGNRIYPVQVFYADYYRLMSTRLFNFGGQAVIPYDTTVISYNRVKDEQGEMINLIASVTQFGNYQNAEAYVAGKATGNWRIVSNNAFVSPVPLEALGHYQLVHGNTEIKIFRYVE